MSDLVEVVWLGINICSNLVIYPLNGLLTPIDVYNKKYKFISHKNKRILHSKGIIIIIKY